MQREWLLAWKSVILCLPISMGTRSVACCNHIRHAHRVKPVRRHIRHHEGYVQACLSMCDSLLRVTGYCAKLGGSPVLQAHLSCSGCQAVPQGRHSPGEGQVRQC